MKFIIKLLKQFWLWFIKLANKKDFILGYPLFIMAAVAVGTRGFLSFLALVVWILVIIVNKDEK